MGGGWERRVALATAHLNTAVQDGSEQDIAMEMAQISTQLLLISDSVCSNIYPPPLCMLSQSHMHTN